MSIFARVLLISVCVVLIGKFYLHVCAHLFAYMTTAEYMTSYRDFIDETLRDLLLLLTIVSTGEYESMTT